MEPRMDRRKHWDAVYTEKSAASVSWYKPHLLTSLALIERAVSTQTARIIDVGGGESTLVDDLLENGFEDITVLDISWKAIAATQERLGSASAKVEWIAADITSIDLGNNQFDVWHDRAVFHFLRERSDRAAYIRQVESSVKPGGHVIVSTFGTEGPEKCSGLAVVRYSSSSLHAEFGKRFRLVETSSENHTTPSGTTQQFLYCWCVVE